MGKYKICVYAIAKNEEQFARRWMESVGEADLVVVLDTGSEDGTTDILRGLGAVVYEEKIDPWRFDRARNIALSYIPGDFDICVSNDLDEVFEKGWRQKLEDRWERHHTRARYTFTWNRNDSGSAEKQFPMEKIHTRNNFRWVHPVHEILEYTGGAPDVTVQIPGIVLHHFPDNSKPRGQYLPLLELSASENPHDCQTVFWLGREYFFHRFFDKAIAALARYLALPAAAWGEERSAAMRFISSCYQEKGDVPAAKKWLFSAIAECPEMREPYVAAARLGYLLSDWPLTYCMAHEALKITAKSGSYLAEPQVFGAAPYDLAAIACFRLGNYELSESFARQAAILEPENERLSDNLAIIESFLKRAGDKDEL